MSIYKIKRIVSKIAIITAIFGTTLNIDEKNISFFNNTYALEHTNILNGWKQENSKWYYYENNEKKTGWLNLGRTWYWLKPNGEMASNEWVKVNGVWYWLKSSGEMASNEWIKDKGIWYWLKSSGEMASNEWIKDKGTWYWLKSGGPMASNEWIKDKGTWYWLKSSGAMACSELLEIDDTWYRFRASGAMSTESIFKIGKVKECDYLNIRSGSGTSYDVLGKIYTNEYIEILEQSSNGWYKIQTGNDITGWVSSKYITVVYEETNNTANEEIINKVIDLAYKQLGKPYKWGAEGPNSFDCSGLTYYVYKNAADMVIPRVSREQAKVGVQVSRSNLQPGDLVFFSSSGTTINHVGLYIGDSNFIHSPQTGDVVKISKISSSYYSKNFSTARRLIQ